MGLYLLQEELRRLVVILNPHRSQPPDTFEPAGLADNDVLLFFDDLHSIAETMQPLSWVERLMEGSVKSCKLVCTSRDGNDRKRVSDWQRPLLEKLGPDALVFTSAVVDELVRERDGNSSQVSRSSDLAGFPNTP